MNGSEHREWQRETALRKIDEARQQSPAPPFARLFADAAAYVGTEPGVVEDWWKRRGR
ncbi:MAG TPA: hypothetical protein VFW19_10690 [Allosphingosinicella sp.]|nr:hypothetical protein [Allosphingosinicella sp.]